MRRAGSRPSRAVMVGLAVTALGAALAVTGILGSGGLRDGTGTVDGAEGAFTFAVIPDTQRASIDGSGTFAAQTEWIAAHRAREGIVAVLHEGDLVEDLDCPDQWEVASAAMAHLDGLLPVAITAGNHDVIRYPSSPCTVVTQSEYVGSDVFDVHFPVDRYRALGAFEGSFAGSLDNSYQRFAVGEVDVLVLTLSFGPSDETLAWADEIVRVHPDDLVVIVTHDYLGDDGELRGVRCPITTDPPCEHALPGGVGGTAFPDVPNTGVQIFEKLVEPHANVRLVVSGHVVACGRSARPDPGCAFTSARRSTTRDDGSRVDAILTNYQSRGTSELRLVTYAPATDSITVRTVTPPVPFS